MLKNISAGLIVFAASGAIAMAADLPSRRLPPAPPPPPPVFSWTGFYAGVNVGDAFSNRASETTTGSPTTGVLSIIPQTLITVGAVPVRHALEGNGITAGGQIGYNYQIPVGVLDGIVLGAEADAGYVGARRNDTVLSTFALTNAYHQGGGFLGTVRGRLGIAIDRLLVYGTVGFAYGNAGYNHTLFTNAPVIAPVYSGGAGGIRTGYVVGGGVEYAIPTTSFLNVLHSGAVTLRAEFLHYDFGSRSVTLNPVAPFGTPGTAFIDQVRSSGNIARAAIDYKLDFAPQQAVVARY